MVFIGVVLTLIGVLLVISFLTSRIRCKTAIEATVGKITEKKRFFRGRTIIDYTPFFEYTVNEKKYTYKADSSTTEKAKFFKGQKVTVFIDPKHPEKARYGNNTGFFIAGIVFAAAGIFVLVLNLM